MRHWNRKKKPFTFKNVLNFFIAIGRWVIGIKWQSDQANWRKSEILKYSKVCMEQGYCKDCGCEFPEKLYENEKCELGCYPKWMNKKEWFIFVKEKNKKQCKTAHKV